MSPHEAIRVLRAIVPEDVILWLGPDTEGPEAELWIQWRELRSSLRISREHLSARPEETLRAWARPLLAEREALLGTPEGEPREIHMRA